MGAAVAAAIAWSVAGCGPGEPATRISVTVDSAHHLVVSYRNCGELVQEIRLNRVPGDTTVWEVRGAPGSAAGVFVSGAPIPGLATVVPMSVLGDGHYELTLMTDVRDAGGLEFAASELAPGTLVWDRGQMSTSDYEKMTDRDLGC